MFAFLKKSFLILDSAFLRMYLKPHIKFKIDNSFFKNGMFQRTENLGIHKSYERL